jgi:hypothetical protein
MQCEAVRETWLTARYAQQTPDAAVREHLASCAPCAAFVDAQRELDGLLLRAEPTDAVHVGLGFDTRFFARLEEERRKATQRRRMRVLVWLAPLATAAAFCVVLLQRGSHELREPSPLAADDLALARDLELVENLPMLRQLDEIEAYPTLSHVSERELDALIDEDQR